MTSMKWTEPTNSLISTSYNQKSTRRKKNEEEKKWTVVPNATECFPFTLVPERKWCVRTNYKCDLNTHLNADYIITQLVIIPLFVVHHNEGSKLISYIGNSNIAHLYIFFFHSFCSFFDRHFFLFFSTTVCCYWGIEIFFFWLGKLIICGYIGDT